MKTADDPRHKKRQKLIQQLFKRDFHTQPITKEARTIFDQLPRIDASIKLAAKEYPIEKINKVDLAILRLAMYELTVVKKEPAHVIIDEAVELAKEFGGPTSPSFINGALGTIVKT